jgi:putative MATE family efflux protein
VEAITVTKPQSIVKNKSRLFFSNRDLFRLFLPLIIEQTLKFTLGLADSVMVSGIGEAAVSGVSLIHFIVSFINSLFTALMIGGAAIIAQYLGNKDEENARDAARQLVTFTLLMGIVITFLIYILKPFILNNIFGKISDDVYFHAETYFNITAISLPFLALYSAGAVMFRCMNNTRLPMTIMIVMNILNILVNAILVYQFNAGTAGIATTTLVTRIAAAAIILVILLNKKYVLNLASSLSFKLNASVIRQIMGIGIPCGMENGMFYLGRIIVVGMVASLGTASIAANSVAGTIIMFQVMPGMAVTLGTTVVIARCVGANDYRQAKFYIKKIVSIIYKTNLISCILVVALLPLILEAYNLSQEAIRMANQIVWIHAAFTVVFWPLSYGLPTAFKASGDATFPMAVSILCMIFCRVAFSYLLGIYLGWGVIGIWLGMFVDWIVKAIFFIYRYSSGKWMYYRSV